MRVTCSRSTHAPSVDKSGSSTCDISTKTKMTDASRLDTLPSDVLLIIFDYCHAFDLVRLSEVCSRFHDIIRSETLWIKRSKQPIATNQASRRFRDRCNPVLCLRTKWHVSNNWQCGRCEKKILFSQKTKLMPWLQLSNDILWWSGGSQLCGFRRSDPFNRNDCVFYEDGIASDICKFVVRGEYIISGHRDGSIKFWSRLKYKDHFDFGIQNAHFRDINAVDEASHTVISGSADGTVKIWNALDDTISSTPSVTINIMDRVWSLAIDPLKMKVAVGSSGNSDIPPLRIFDLECYSDSIDLKHNWRRGAGILDMVWDNPQTLLTCGYDTYIRKWDTRTGTCVNSWPDPTDATLYCISSDYQYTMITGTQFNCKAVLWDQRQKHYIQLYFMNLQRISSPVYCIGFDSSHLYGATDRHLIELTFSGHSYMEKNYREILNCEWICSNSNNASSLSQ